MKAGVLKNNKAFQINMEKFESFNYQNYLGRIGVAAPELKKNFLNNLSSDAVILKVPERAFAILTRRDWDRNILGINTYSIDDVYIKTGLRDDYGTMEELIKIIIDYAVNANIELLTFRFSSERIKYLQLFEKYGFITTDILATFLLNKEGPHFKSDTNSSSKVRPARKKDYGGILKMATDSFKFSRIYIDDNIPGPIADKFYFELTKGMLNERDNLKLVTEERGRIAGFAIGSKAKNINMFFEKKLGYLWLISVLRQYRRRHVAKGLLNEFFIKFLKEVDYIEMSTQITNISAINLYSSFRLRPETYIITTHYWNKR